MLMVDASQNAASAAANRSIAASAKTPLHTCVIGNTVSNIE
jgi:hypothetical protein